MRIVVRGWLNNLPRTTKQFILVAFDFHSLLLVIWLAYSIRLGSPFQPKPVELALMLLAPVICVPIFTRLGLYRAVIRYLPDRAAMTIFKAMALATLIWVGALFLVEVSRLGSMPRSVPISFLLGGTIIVAGSRFLVKRLLWTPLRQMYKAGEVVIYGAGQAGIELSMALRNQGSRYVAGFVDDDPALQNRDVAGLRVYSPRQMDYLIENLGVQEVIISMPLITTSRRQELVAALSRHPVKIRTLPAISDLAAGKYLVNQIREIDIDDLLGRSSVPADPDLLRAMIQNRSILVSGAGGSIGSELTRLIVKWSPRSLILFEANEFALYQIERNLREHSDAHIVPVLGSVTNKVLVNRILAEHDVQVVFHAAAHKHVPLVEQNALEGIRNNVFGTEAIATAAFEQGVENFVLISTDKAVRPTTVMGATKRWAELIVSQAGRQSLESGSKSMFSTVRFGNVLGSNGSVVPLFREQIAKGGPVTLTHEDMMRYFMSIHEAAELIVQAGALSEGGDVFLLEMGEPVRIRTLAENMIRLAGFTVRSADNPGGDIDIVVTGTRPAEKLSEELFYEPASAAPTRHPKILRARRGENKSRNLDMRLADLRAALERGDEAGARTVLFDFVRDV